MLEVQEELFCADGFDCYAWVEEALIESSGRAEELAPLVPQLTLLSQSLTRAVHATLHQLSVMGPQLQSHVDALHAATLPLQQQLDAVMAHVGGNDASWSTSHRKKEDARALQHLVTLHDAKQRLQACSQALVEAAKWEQNVRACAAALEEPDVGIASSASPFKDAQDAAPSLANRVREMRTSLDVLCEMPGADDRRVTLQSLCAQIEARVTPALVALLREEHVPVARVQTCLALLASIGRGALARDEYCKGRPAHVHRVWFTFSSGEDAAAPSFAGWLEGFYSDVYVMLQRESHHIRELFGAESVVDVLVALLQSTFASIRASFQDRLTASLSSSISATSASEDALAPLLRAFQSSTAFAAQVAQLLRALESGDKQQSADVAGAVLASIFDPYRVFFHEYAAHAGAALTRDLLALVPRFVDPRGVSEAAVATDVDDVLGDRGEGALDEFAQRVEDASKPVWAFVDESMKQCYAFSAGAAFPEAVDAVAQAVHAFARALAAAIPSMRRFCNLSGASSGAPDWSKFHAALALLRACGTLEQDLCAMEIRVKARVGEQLHQFIQTDADHTPTMTTTSSTMSSSPRSSRKTKERRFDASASFALAELVDPTKLVAAVATTWLRDDAARCSAFVQFAHECHDAWDAMSSSSLLETATSMNAVLFADAQMALREWIRDVQLLTFDTVFAPIARLLERVPKNEVLPACFCNWTKTTDAALGDLPSFSTLPQEYITTVADLLLSLLPQLEQFAESSSLHKAATASYGLETACVVGPWQRLGAVLGLSEHEMAACVATFATPTAMQQGLDAAAADLSTATTANDFVDLWTSAVASGALATLLCAMCAIPALSDRGVTQLSADLGYFHNVLSAVGGSDTPTNALVDDLRRALDLPLADHAQHVKALVEHDAVLAKLNASLVAKRERAASNNGAKLQATRAYY